MKKNRGFTLLEMLIIVGCIAALVAIGYPQFTGMMENNREKTDIIAMKSAYTLLETAYNTGLLIDGQPVTAYDAGHPLYYDGNGKLTAVKPTAPYGEGRARSGSGAGSYCEDYRYDPSRDYTADVIVCFYDADTKTLHVHWEPLATAGGGSTGGGSTGGSTGGNTGGGTTGGGTTGGGTGGGTGKPDPGETPVEPTTGEDKSGGSDNFQDPIFKNLKSHEFPFTNDQWKTSGYRLHLHHVYRFTDSEGVEHVYVSLFDDGGDKTYRYDSGGTPLPGGNYENNVAEPNGIVLTRSGDENGNFQLYKDRKVSYGTIFRDDDGKYYIFKAGRERPTETTFPEENSNWVEINLGCPDHCGAVID